MAVLETQLFGRELLAFPAGDGNRGRLRRSHDLQDSGVDFHIPGRQLGIPHRGRPGGDIPFHEDDGLGPDGLGTGDEIGSRPPRTEGDLNEAVAVAEIEEDDAAEVTAAVNPAPQSHPLSNVLLSQRPAAMSAPGCPSLYAPPLSASQRIWKNSSGVCAPTRRARIGSRRTSREIRLSAFTCAPACASVPASKKKRRTGSPSTVS